MQKFILNGNSFPHVSALSPLSCPLDVEGVIQGVNYIWNVFFNINVDQKRWTKTGYAIRCFLILEQLE